MSDLDVARARLAERGGLLGLPLTLQSSTTSTNDDAKRAAREGAPHGACWVAETQSAGRGRQGRSWIGAPKSSLLFSVLLRAPGAALERLSLLALVAGLAVRDAVAKATGRSDIGLKWPNDVVASGAPGSARKVAGILVESMVQGRQVEAVVVGIGVNVLSTELPTELADIATSVALLRTDQGSPLASLRADLLVDILAGLEAEADYVLARGLGRIHARLREADALQGKRVSQGPGQQGVAEGIDLDGRLCVRDDTGILHRWNAGEVHLGTGAR
ncbi:MAG: biotin--[acetyl-CoA-carboxylase] ligase [Polyangiaceae bacterium]|nr:biotin--[acetyl-CoA-carboxylase] ligase [Polyangiaceae bacterium]